MQTTKLYHFTVPLTTLQTIPCSVYSFANWYESDYEASRIAWDCFQFSLTSSLRYDCETISCSNNVSNMPTEIIGSNLFKSQGMD